MGSGLSFPEVEMNTERIFLVTGGNTGIGYETAKKIAIMGGHVIIACRNMTKAETAIKQMQEDYEAELTKKENKAGDIAQVPKKLSVESMEVDLSSFESTMKFIEAFKARNSKLHVLVCNAGVIVHEKQLTEDGYEIMLQANFLSHFLILLHFLPILSRSGPDCRVVHTNSDAYKFGKTAMDNINGEKSFGDVTFYSNSKLYQLMAMYWLGRHIKDKHIDLFCCHPGLVNTQQTQQSRWTASGVGKLIRLMSRDPAKGAATIIKAATDPSLVGKSAVYMKDCKVTTTYASTRNEDKQNSIVQYSLTALEKHLPTNMNEFLEM